MRPFSSLSATPRFSLALAVVFSLGVAALVLARAAPASAQAELLQWVDPTFGKMMGRGDYRIQFFSEERVEDQNARLDLTQHNFTLVTPLFQDTRNEWSVSARLRYQDYETRAVLPDSGQPFPGQLYDARAGLSYRHKFDNNWILGGNVTFGSASDKPFHSEDELILRVSGLLRVPSGERNAWLFTLTYASDQQIGDMRHIPIPGIAYFYSPSDKLKVVVGFPFSSIEYKPIEQVTLEASYFPVRTFRARATWAIFRPLRVFLGFDADHDAYYLADRGDKDDQLFQYEKRVTLGMRFDLRHVGFELTGGYIFDRFYFEGERYSERNENRFDVADGTFVGARLSFRW